jgi:hypothetical protein
VTSLKVILLDLWQRLGLCRRQQPHRQLYGRARGRPATRQSCSPRRGPATRSRRRDRPCAPAARRAPWRSARNCGFQSSPLRVSMRALPRFSLAPARVAVELDLMQPFHAGRRAVDQRGELGLDEFGKGCAGHGASTGGGGAGSRSAGRSLRRMRAGSDDLGGRRRDGERELGPASAALAADGPFHQVGYRILVAEPDRRPAPCP